MSLGHVGINVFLCPLGNDVSLLLLLWFENVKYSEYEHQIKRV